jgi:hypothetical protein
MPNTIVKYKDWVFEVDKELTEQTYADVLAGGADSCRCDDCKNYVAYRDNIFPIEILELFAELGIDYRKEVEITVFEVKPNGLHHIMGWFHFKGYVLSGKDYRVPIHGTIHSGYTFDLTKIHENLSIGFAEGNDLTFFKDREDLVQIQFAANIPWVIDKSLE